MWVASPQQQEPWQPVLSLLWGHHCKRWETTAPPANPASCQAPHHLYRVGREQLRQVQVWVSWEQQWEGKLQIELLSLYSGHNHHYLGHPRVTQVCSRKKTIRIKQLISCPPYPKPQPVQAQLVNTVIINHNHKNQLPFVLIFSPDLIMS